MDGRRAGLAAVLMALSACTPGAPSGPIVVHNDPISLDPHRQNEVPTYGILANVYEGLTAFDSELRVGPALASSWENPDQLTWQFDLREARFHDGRPLTAEDVVFSLERARGPRSSFASYLVEIASVRALGVRRIELITKRPFAPLLNKLAFISIVPKGSPDTIEAPVGTGAYRFVSFERGRRLRLEPAATYWQPDPWRRPLEFLPVGDPGARAPKLIAGDVDVV